MRWTLKLSETHFSRYDTVEIRVILSFLALYPSILRSLCWNWRRNGRGHVPPAWVRGWSTVLLDHHQLFQHRTDKRPSWKIVPNLWQTLPRRTHNAKCMWRFWTGITTNESIGKATLNIKMFRTKFLNKILGSTSCRNVWRVQATFWWRRNWPWR